MARATLRYQANSITMEKRYVNLVATVNFVQAHQDIESTKTKPSQDTRILVAEQALAMEWDNDHFKSLVEQIEKGDKDLIVANELYKLGTDQTA